MSVRPALMAFLLAGSAAIVQAQGLGAAAQKEKDKRAAKDPETKSPAAPTGAKVYTADDLVAYGGATAAASTGSTGDPSSLGERDKAARAAYAAAMEDWKEAGKARKGLGAPPTGRDRGAQDRYDRNMRDADRRYREAEEAIAAARRGIEAVEEEARRQLPPSGDSPMVRLPTKDKGEAGPGITKEERSWRDRVTAARDSVTKAEEKLEAAEKAQAGVGAARQELAKANASLQKTLEIARQQGFDLR